MTTITKEDLIELCWRDWTVEEVTRWISQDLGLPQYAKAFKVQGIDGWELSQLTEDSLKYRLCVQNPVHRKKMLAHMRLVPLLQNIRTPLRRPSRTMSGLGDVQTGSAPMFPSGVPLMRAGSSRGDAQDTGLAQVCRQTATIGSSMVCRRPSTADAHSRRSSEGDFIEDAFAQMAKVLSRRSSLGSCESSSYDEPLLTDRPRRHSSGARSAGYFQDIHADGAGLLATKPRRYSTCSGASISASTSPRGFSKSTLPRADYSGNGFRETAVRPLPQAEVVPAPTLFKPTCQSWNTLMSAPPRATIGKAARNTLDFPSKNSAATPGAGAYSPRIANDVRRGCASGVLRSPGGAFSFASRFSHGSRNQPSWLQTQAF